MSKISRGRLKYLWSLYGVKKTIELREFVYWLERRLTPETIKRAGELQARLDKAIQLLPTGVPGDMISAGYHFDPSQAKPFVPMDPFVAVVAKQGYYDGVRKLNSEFDLEVMVSCQKAPVNYFTIDRSKPRKDSFEILEAVKDIDIEDTYPKTVSVVDEENLDRLIRDITLSPDRVIRLDELEDQGPLVELVGGIWQRKRND